MRARTIVTTAAIVAAFAALTWSRFSLQERIRAVEDRLAEVTTGIVPIHTRCLELEGLLTGVEQDLASVRVASTALIGTVASHAALISESGGRLQQVDSKLLEAREEAGSRSTQLEKQLERHIKGAGAAEQRVAELATQLELLEERLDGFPAGTILPWLPGRGSVPRGWLLCDGSRGTPDLRGRFLRGAGRLSEAGLYYKSAKMSPAGVHAHATDVNRSIYNLSRASPKKPGDWLILFDAGVGGSDPETLASHGSHTHADEHVPAHFTVVFIMKVTSTPRSER